MVRALSRHALAIALRHYKPGRTPTRRCLELGNLPSIVLLLEAQEPDQGGTFLVGQIELRRAALPR